MVLLDDLTERGLLDQYRPAATALNWNGLTVDQLSLLSVSGWDGLLADHVPTGGAGKMAYSPAGNRLTQTDPVTGDITTFTYDNGNRLLTGVDVSGTTTHTYDNNGNQLTIEEPSGDITTNTWDGENRLIQVEHPSGDVTTYAYNGDGLRVLQDDGVAETRFVYDGNNLVLELDDVGVVKADVTYLPAEYATAISQHRDLESSFYLCDGIHNVRQLTDDAQVVTDEYSFDGWGKLTSSTGSTANSQLYKGEYLAYRKDPDAGPELQYSTHHRNYNPQTGVFTAADPAKDDLNLYRYVKNNPVNQVDPSGLRDDDTPNAMFERVRAIVALQVSIAEMPEADRKAKVKELQQERAAAFNRIQALVSRQNFGGNPTSQMSTDEYRRESKSDRWVNSSWEVRSLVAMGADRHTKSIIDGYSEIGDLFYNVVLPIDTVLLGFEQRGGSSIGNTTAAEASVMAKNARLRELQKRMENGDQTAYWSYLKETDQTFMFWFGPGGAGEHIVFGAGGFAPPKAIPGSMPVLQELPSGRRVPTTIEIPRDPTGRKIGPAVQHFPDGTAVQLPPANTVGGSTGRVTGQSQGSASAPQSAPEKAPAKVPPAVEPKVDAKPSTTKLDDGNVAPSNAKAELSGLKINESLDIQDAKAAQNALEHDVYTNPSALKTTIKGTPDKPHELPQAQRFGKLQGGGEFEFYGNSSPGVEGVFRPTGQPGVDIPVSLKSYHDVDKLGNLLKDIRRNSNTSQAAGVKNGIFYGEPTKFTTDQLADFARNGPLSQAIVKDGAFNKIILKASDGIVEITPSGVKAIK